MSSTKSLSKPKARRTINKKSAKVLPTLKKHQLRTYLKKRASKAMGEFKTSKDYIVREQKNNWFVSNLTKQTFECIICLSVIVFPYKLQCSHIYCFMCIDKLSGPGSVGGHKCPSCRTAIGEEYPTFQKTWSNLVSLAMEKCNPEEKKQYQQRQMVAKSQLNERVNNFKSLQVRDKIDCRIGNTWYIGRIIEIDEVKSKFTVRVISDIKKNLYQFRRTSPHLALYGTFTKHLKCLPESPFSSDDQMGYQGYLDSFRQSGIPNTHSSLLQGRSARNQ